jgi:hypothetical protein
MDCLCGSDNPLSARYDHSHLAWCPMYQSSAIQSAPVLTPGAETPHDQIQWALRRRERCREYPEHARIGEKFYLSLTDLRELSRLAAVEQQIGEMLQQISARTSERDQAREVIALLDTENVRLAAVEQEHARLKREGQQ